MRPLPRVAPDHQMTTAASPARFVRGFPGGPGPRCPFTTFTALLFGPTLPRESTAATTKA